MFEKKKRLGKGLDALLSPTKIREIEKSSSVGTYDDSIDKTSNEKELINELDIDLIQTNPYQPRRNWDEKKINDLAESIKANGLIQPIVVRPLGSGYQIIAGERRLKAMKIAELKKIPAIIRQATEEQVLEWALVENIHRSDLNPVERARAYQQYLKSFSLTQQEAAQRLGEDRSTIANYIRLLELPLEIQQMINEEKISMGHARALLGINETATQRILADEIVKKNLSVREIEQKVKRQQIKKVDEKSKNKVNNPNIVELEQEMSRKLATKVTIKTSGLKGKRGKIIIEYYSLDD